MNMASHRDLMQTSFGLGVLKFVALHPKSNKALKLALIPVQVISTALVIVVCYYQLFFGKNDLESFVTNFEACGAMSQVG